MSSRLKLCVAPFSGYAPPCNVNFIPCRSEPLDVGQYHRHLDKVLNTCQSFFLWIQGCSGCEGNDGNDSLLLILYVCLDETSSGPCWTLRWLILAFRITRLVALGLTWSCAGPSPGSRSAHIFIDIVSIIMVGGLLRSRLNSLTRFSALKSYSLPDIEVLAEQEKSSAAAMSTAINSINKWGSIRGGMAVASKVQ